MQRSAAMSSQSLKLRAEDTADLAVISAIMQDAIIAPTDMHYDIVQQRFLLAASRFRWESYTEHQPVGERINTLLTIEQVTILQSTGLPEASSKTMIELLALLHNPPSLDLIFAGGASIKLTITGLSLKLDDFGAAWPTSACPKHEGRALPSPAALTPKAQQTT
jgi:hypothetical protein